MELLPLQIAAYRQVMMMKTVFHFLLNPAHSARCVSVQHSLLSQSYAVHVCVRRVSVESGSERSCDTLSRKLVSLVSLLPGSYCGGSVRPSCSDMSLTDGAAGIW